MISTFCRIQNTMSSEFPSHYNGVSDAHRRLRVLRDNGICSRQRELHFFHSSKNMKSRSIFKLLTAVASPLPHHISQYDLFQHHSNSALQQPCVCTRQLTNHVQSGMRFAPRIAFFGCAREADTRAYCSIPASSPLLAQQHSESRWTINVGFRAAT